MRFRSSGVSRTDITTGKGLRARRPPPARAAAARVWATMFYVSVLGALAEEVQERL
jgi:hypothetical protein